MRKMRVKVDLFPAGIAMVDRDAGLLMEQLQGVNGFAIDVSYLNHDMVKIF